MSRKNIKSIAWSMVSIRHETSLDLCSHWVTIWKVLLLHFSPGVWKPQFDGSCQSPPNEGDPPAAIRCPQLFKCGPLQGQMLPCFQIALSTLDNSCWVKSRLSETLTSNPDTRGLRSLPPRRHALLSSRVRLEAEGPAQPVSTCQISTAFQAPDSLMACDLQSVCL